MHKTVLFYSGSLPALPGDARVPVVSLLKRTFVSTLGVLAGVCVLQVLINTADPRGDGKEMSLNLRSLETGPHFVPSLQEVPPLWS